MALINPNAHIKQLRDFEDRLSDAITSFAGNIKFVYFHGVWFALWIGANLGLLGVAVVFDPFPFGLLTMIVSLEAIFLSTFVMISQNRAADKAELRSQLDYETDVQAEKEIGIIMRTLVRVAEKQGIDIKDLKAEMDEVRGHADREAKKRTGGR
jgi:uncharacterized membrane protein